MQKVKAHVSLQAIYHNATVFQSHTKTRLCAVVKANAYGHGAEQVVYALHSVAHCFAVSLVEEAKAIRIAACGRDILVLTPPLSDEEIYDGIYNGFLLTVSNIQTAKRIAQAAQRLRLPARVHLKVNTGMNRYGMDESTLKQVCKHLQHSPFVKVEGIYSHLYQTNIHTAKKQRELFMCMQSICKEYYPNVIAHISATYGALLGEDFAFDMVRIGIGLYGYFPDGAQDIPRSTYDAFALEKALRITATVVCSAPYRFGGAGYGTPVWENTNTQPPKRLSVCRIGYADGVLRQRNNGTKTCAEYANNACMDATILMGNHTYGEEICIMQDAAKTAKETGTISYEVLCAATRRAEFIYDGT